MADSDVQSLIYDLILDGGAPPPVLDGGLVPQQLYVIYFPSGTQITLQGSTSCNG